MIIKLRFDKDEGRRNMKKYPRYFYVYFFLRTVIAPFDLFALNIDLLNSRFLKNSLCPDFIQIFSKIRIKSG